MNQKHAKSLLLNSNANTPTVATTNEIRELEIWGEKVNDQLIACIIRRDIKAAHELLADSLKKLKSDYYRLALLYHPDRCLDEHAAEKFKELQNLRGKLEKKWEAAISLTKEQADQLYGCRELLAKLADMIRKFSEEVEADERRFQEDVEFLEKIQQRCEQQIKLNAESIKNLKIEQEELLCQIKSATNSLINNSTGQKTSLIDNFVGIIDQLVLFFKNMMVESELRSVEIERENRRLRRAELNHQIIQLKAIINTKPEDALRQEIASFKKFVADFDAQTSDAFDKLNKIQKIIDNRLKESGERIDELAKEQQELLQDIERLKGSLVNVDARNSVEETTITVFQGLWNRSPSACALETKLESTENNASSELLLKVNF